MGAKSTTATRDSRQARQSLEKTLSLCQRGFLIPNTKKNGVAFRLAEGVQGPSNDELAHVLDEPTNILQSQLLSLMPNLNHSSHRSWAPAQRSMFPLNVSRRKGQHMRTSRLLLASVLALAFGPLFAAWESSLLPSDFAHEDSLERAASRAAKEGKAVVVYYTRTRCPPCDLLKSRLRIESVAKPYRENYVFTAVWGSSMNFREREHYRSAYNVAGAPTWLFFNAAGKYLCTASGGFFSEEQSANLHSAVQALLSQADTGDALSPRTCQ